MSDNIKRKRKVLFFLIILIIFIIILLWESVYPFIFGLILAFVIDMVNKKFIRLGIRPNLSILFTIFVFLIFIFLFFAFVLPFILKQSYSILLNITDYAKIGQDIIEGFVKWLKKMGLLIKKEFLTINISNSINSIIYSVFNSLVDYAVYSIRFIIDLLIILMTCFYFLRDKKKITNFFSCNFAGVISNKESVFISQIGLKLNSYFKSILVISLVVMLFVTIVLSLFGVQNSVAIGFFSGIISVIPYIGPTIHIIFIAMIQLTNNFSTVSILLVIVLQLVFYTFIGFYLQPKILSKSLKMHPLIVIMSIIIGNYLYGIMGMIFAMPVTILIQSFFEVYFKTYLKS